MIIVNLFLFLVDFVFIRLLQAVPFSFLGYDFYSRLFPLPKFSRIYPITAIRCVLVGPFPYL